jgi:ketosteroid isomerase-like protein
MKKTIFISLIWLFCLGCVMQGSAQIGPQEQETAKKEIGEVVNVIFRCLEKMDVEALFQSYSDSLGFILVTTEGFFANYQGAKIGNAEWFRLFSAMKISTIKEEFRFLPGNVVLCAWQGKFEMTLKTGEQLKIDRFGITFVFSKIDNLWKVVYQHSSSLPPMPQKP